MSRILVSEALSSELTDGLRSVASIEIADSPFAAGGFGEVYLCVTVDGRPPPSPLAAKLFASGVGGECYSTIRRLQQKLRDPIADARRRVPALPGLVALPQLSFRGRHRGSVVSGYLAQYLDPTRFTQFDALFEGPQALAMRTAYQRSLPVWCKLRLGRQLAESVGFLREIGYIHADINAENIFIDTAAPHLALIDYDSGAVTDDVAALPTTWGKPNEWVAPEILEQLRGHSDVRIDLFTDSWSVAVGVYYLLFLWPPYCFLEQQSTRDLRAYLGRYDWPSIPAANLSRSAIPGHRQIIGLLEGKAYLDGVYRRCRETFNAGALQPAQRTTYFQWAEALKTAEEKAPQAGLTSGVQIVALGSTAAPPQASRRPRQRPVAVQPRNAAPAHAPVPLAAAPAGLQSVKPISLRRGTVVTVVLLLGLLGWLVSRASQRPAGIDPGASAQAEAPAADQARRVEENRISERRRIEQGIVGQWKGGSLDTLTITSEGGRLRAEMPVQVTPGFTSSHTVLQAFHGEILANNEVHLTNSQMGKLGNPYNYYDGPFSQEAWIVLSADSASLTARFTRVWDNNSVVLNRVTENGESHDRMMPASDEGPIGPPPEPTSEPPASEQASRAPPPSDQASTEDQTTATGGTLAPSPVGRYVRKGSSTDYAVLYPDGRFFMQENGKTAAGTYSVGDGIITMRLPNGTAGKGRLLGNTLIDPEGMTWEKQAEPRDGPGPGYAGEAWRRRDAVSGATPAKPTPRLRSPERW